MKPSTSTGISSAAAPSMAPHMTAISKPPSAASAEPMMKVSEMIQSALMPSRRAILRFCAVARMALPMRVWRTNRESAAIERALTRRMMKSLGPMM